MQHNAHQSLQAARENMEAKAKRFAEVNALVLSHLAMTGYFCVKEGEAQTGFDDNPLVRTGLNVFVVGVLGLSTAVIMSVVLK